MADPETARKEARERFVRETREHEMSVLRDDGLYRHLRFSKPGTNIYCFDIVTWPGYLAIVGDAGDFVFSRTRDMFEWFGPDGAHHGFEDVRWGITPGYWSEKLQAPKPGAAETYSYDLYRQRVLDWLNDKSGEMDAAAAAALRVAVDEQLLADHLDAVHSEHDAHVLLREFEHDGVRIYESWDWDLREYRWDFLWCCWAIVWGIGLYRARDGVALPGAVAGSCEGQT